MDPRAGQLFPDSCREEERRAPAVEGGGGGARGVGDTRWEAPECPVRGIFNFILGRL